MYYFNFSLKKKPNPILPINFDHPLAAKDECHNRHSFGYTSIHYTFDKQLSDTLPILAKCSLEVKISLVKSCKLALHGDGL